MRNRLDRRRSNLRGFSLVELAVVMSIVALLMGGLMYTLSAQVEQRNFEDTRRRLDQARELVQSFAVVKGRLPCPASSTSAGDEAPSGGGTCTVTNYAGWLPAKAIGYQQVDSGGYAVDAWGNRIRYAVSLTTWGTTPFARFTKQHVSGDATAAWSVTQTPGDLVVCSTATGATGTSCAVGSAVTNQNILVAIIFSTGKNGALTCTDCTDEAANNGADPVFVYHTPTPSTATGGEFDDQFTWITVGELYGRLIAAGVLP